MGCFKVKGGKVKLSQFCYIVQGSVHNYNKRSAVVKTALLSEIRPTSDIMMHYYCIEVKTTQKNIAHHFTQQYINITSPPQIWQYSNILTHMPQ